MPDYLGTYPTRSSLLSCDVLVEIATSDEPELCSALALANDGHVRVRRVRIEVLESRLTRKRPIGLEDSQVSAQIVP
jgi:hypothetical protein